MGQNKSKSLLTIYSHNVGGDSANENLIHVPGMEQMTFKNRFKALYDSLSKLIDEIDVIAFNEIRYSENVELVKKYLDELRFESRSFSNNNSVKSLHNILAIKISSKWKDPVWKHKWVAYENEESRHDFERNPMEDESIGNCARITHLTNCRSDKTNNDPTIENRSKDGNFYLSDEYSLIDGDPHGRSAGIVYLTNSESNKKVCVMTSHVSPFGEVKTKQQNSLFSLNIENIGKKPPVPTVIVGDMNRFNDENDSFQRRLKEHNLSEVNLKRLVITSSSESTQDQVYSNEEDVGTYMPWSVESIYHDKLRESLSTSRLDVHLCTDNSSKVVVVDAFARATVYRKLTSDDPPEGINRIRHLLDNNMVSDHLAIVGTYNIQ